MVDSNAPESWVLAVQQHGRKLFSVQSLNEGFGRRHPDHQRTICVPANAAFLENSVALIGAFDGANDQRKVGVGERVFNAAQDFDDKLLREQWNEHFELVGPSPPKGA